MFAAPVDQPGGRGTPVAFHPHFLFVGVKKKVTVEPSKEKTPPGGHRPPGDAALNRPAQRPYTPYRSTGGAFRRPPNFLPRAGL